MFDVFLYIYDLSGGLARTFSPVLLGKRLDGIWHTGVVVHGKEFFYGSQGISYCPPCGTVLGEPGEKMFMGRTNVTERDLFNHLDQLSSTTFRGGEYRLFDHNCNTFSNHLVRFLTDTAVPSYIMDMPNEVASTPLGAILKPAFNTFAAGLNNQSQFNSSSAAEGLEDDAMKLIKRSFRPILFDEPLSSEFLPHRVGLLWSAENMCSENAVHARLLSESITGKNAQGIIDPDCYSLLDIEKLQTEDQCMAVFELFRVAVWQNPSLLMAMLTDPQKHIHKLASATLPTVSPMSLLDLHASRARLLCNCLSISWTWSLDDGDDLQLDLGPMLHICLLLLDHEEHRVNSIPSSPPLPEHQQVGLALAHDLALYPTLDTEMALELGSYLIHLASKRDKTYKQPIEATYLLRAIYFLVLRFSPVADLARAYDLRGCLSVVLNESTRTEQADSTGATGTNGQNSVCDSGADYLAVTKLLEFLNDSGH
ncbi:unnamed protein product [Calicophoron daubneyi]|uniref:PPPDE domain-containing protein n=1 Tax=Calicophoron daubneyi TaxID=300641 RepID=A0AAV2T2J6_CALDB